MAKRFTDLTLQNLKAAGVRREVPIGAGLYAVVQPSGKKSFAVRYRFDGKPRKLTLSGGLTLAAARKLCSDAMVTLEDGKDPATAKKAAKVTTAEAKAQSVQWVCEEWLKREGKKLRTVRERDRAFRVMVYPEIGAVPLLALKRSHITRLLDTIQDERGDRAADLVLAYLRSALSWHSVRDDDFSSPIVKGMGRYNAKENQGERTLSDDEVRRVWKATESPSLFGAFVRFTLLTGARRNEVNRLPWSEIAGTDWMLPAARNKVKVDLTRPLSKAAMTALESVPRIDGGTLVFSTDGRRPMHLARPHTRLMKESGVADWTLHDLRRTARTMLATAGVPDAHAERCMGHVLKGAVAQVYNKHQYQREMALAYETLAAHIERVVNPIDNVTPIKAGKRPG